MEIAELSIQQASAAAVAEPNQIPAKNKILREEGKGKKLRRLTSATRELMTVMMVTMTMAAVQ